MLKPKIRHQGFTIVELLIVVVVIAILASISLVTYTGIQQRAASAAGQIEARQWRDLFIMYKAANGTYPSPVASGDPMTSGGPGSNVRNYYCLGTGFPQVSGSPYCFVIWSGSTWEVAESTGSHLLSQLRTIGSPPVNSKKYIYGDVAGPWLTYTNSNSLQVYSTFKGGQACPSGMQTGWGDANRQDCYYQLD